MKASDLDLTGAARAVKRGTEAIARFAGRNNAKRAKAATERVRKNRRVK